MLQCALDVMVCALGGRFNDWIMNRNSALVTTVLYSSICPIK